MSKFMLFLFVAICAIQILSQQASAAPLYDVSGETTEDPMQVLNAAMEQAKAQIMAGLDELMKSLGQDLPNQLPTEKTTE